MGIEQNIKASFRDVKLEMISIKGQILRFAEEQKELRDLILKAGAKSNPAKKKSKPAAKKKSSKKKK